MIKMSTQNDEKVEKWEVGPTEEVVQALMETLVEPLLPLRASIHPPSMDSQISVAKQMHAVVLLYNYHHRKQKAELRFLNFPYFCQLAVVLKPALIAYMKLFKETEAMDSNTAEDHLSLTEKSIREACDISFALDASRNIPNIQGWLVSEVAVLLIDSKKENCFLQFGAVAQETWSLIEVEVSESNLNQGILGAEKVGGKGKQDGEKGSTDDNDQYLQRGYDAVKEVTGINTSDLEVLETHVTYSSMQKNSAARFYLMQYNGSFSDKEQVPLETLVESLRGPLAKKLAYGFWKTTPVVEYHCLLPYAEFISCWLSRKDLCTPSLNLCNAQSTVNTDKTETSQVPAVDFTHSKPDSDYIDKSSEIGIKSPDKIISKEESVTNAVLLDKESDECQKGSLSGPCEGLQEMDTCDYIETFQKREDASKKLNSEIKVYRSRRKNNSSTQHDAQNDGAELKVDKADCLKQSDSQSNDDKLPVDNGKETAVHNQDGINAETEKELVQIEVEKECDVEDQSERAKEESENALALLYRQRQELSSKIYGMEDTLALYENIISRIRDGDDIGLARQWLKSILSGNDHFLPEREKKTETYVPGKSSCLDLEYISLKNNWRQPRYFTQPSVGKFVSSVVVGRKDSKLSSTGGLEMKPYEARESAAAQMIATLRNSPSSV